MGLINVNKCKECGRKGIFLTLCEDGLCSICHQKASKEAEEKKRLQQLEEERKKAEEEQLKKIQAEQELQFALTKYYELVQCYKAHKISIETCTLEDLQQSISTGKKFCTMLSEVASVPRIDEAFAQDSYMGMSRILNATFGSFELRADSSICLDNLLDEVHQNCEKYQEIITKSQKFETLLSTIPGCNTRLEIKSLYDPTVKPLPMKESNITKRTAISKINNFFAIDVETTGLSLDSAEIIQIAAVRFSNFQPIEAMVSFVHPKKGLNPSAEKINHITEEHVAKAPNIEQVLPTFDAYLSEGIPIIGHNLSFDYNFLYANGSRVMVESLIKGPKLFDTLSLSKRTYSSAKYNLEYLCRKKLGIVRKSNHNALSDALAAGLLFAAICESRIM